MTPKNGLLQKHVFWPLEPQKYVKYVIFSTDSDTTRHSASNGTRVVGIAYKMVPKETKNRKLAKIVRGYIIDFFEKNLFG